MRPVSSPSLACHCRSFGLGWFFVLFISTSVLPIGGRLGTLDIAPTRVTGAYLIDSLLAGDVSLFWSSAIHLILPALTLAAGSVAVVTRMMRASVLETWELTTCDRAC